jgi:hypothetical protein
MTTSSTDDAAGCGLSTDDKDAEAETQHLARRRRR